MLTREQKRQQIDAGAAELKQSRTLVFADFTGVKFGDLKKLRHTLRQAGAKFRVFKKRLLRIALKETGVDFNPEQFESQLGTVFAPGDIYGLAGAIHKLGSLKILGGFNLGEQRFITAEEFMKIARLPSREALLGQLAMLFTIPMKKLLVVFNGRKEKLTSS